MCSRRYSGQRAIEDFKGRQRDRPPNLGRAAGASRPGLRSDTFVLLIDGARVSRHNVRTSGQSATLLQICRGVLAFFGVARRQRSETTSRCAMDGRALPAFDARDAADGEVAESCRRYGVGVVERATTLSSAPPVDT